MTESLLIALLAGLAGVMLAYWGSSLLLSLSPSDMPRQEEVGLDLRVLGFAMLLTLLTGIAFGLAPALSLLRPARGAALRERAVSGGWKASRLQPLLITAQVCICFVLLAGAALLSQSWAGLLSVDPGFRPQSLLTFQLSLPSQYSQGRQTADFYDQLMQRLEALPAVLSAGAVSHLPLSGNRQSNTIQAEGAVEQPDGLSPESERREVHPGYFHTASIPLLEGRLFGRQDQQDTPAAAVVNRTLARRFWPGQSAIGKRFLFRNRPLSVIGVVGDVRHSGLDQTPLSMFYLSLSQFQRREMVVALRTPGDPLSVIQAARQAVWDLDGTLPVTKVAAMESVVDDWMAGRRYRTLLVSAFALLACALACFGIFSVTSRSVRSSRRELGIRLALGADRKRILSLVLGRGLTVTLAGVALGALAAWGLSRFLAGLLYGVQPTDPVTYLGTALLISAASLAAGYLPARKASRIDPAATLKAE